ncbi:MAG: CD225/dispanin family protein [Mediterranea sp.]|jgi:ribosomal protein L40E/predicted secreted protein|nr:CD225/dispanin family protein [Mediterranea sp.]
MNLKTELNMYCKKCGAEVADNAVVCGNCGASLLRDSSSANNQGGAAYGQGGYSQNFPPPSYLVWAILTTIFCCLPFGIVSIVNAASVESRFRSGDVQGALRASANAKKWAIAAAISWAVILVIYFFFAVMVGVAGIAGFGGL